MVVEQWQWWQGSSDGGRAAVMVAGQQ